MSESTSNTLRKLDLIKKIMDLINKVVTGDKKKSHLHTASPLQVKFN